MAGITLLNDKTVDERLKISVHQGVKTFRVTAGVKLDTEGHYEKQEQ